MKKVRWIVSLSNGETLYEERGNFKTVEGDLSPWGRLLAYLDEGGHKITSIALVNDENGRRYHLPSVGNSPKFHAFANAPKPEGYNFFRKLGGDVINGKIDPETSDHFTVIEAQYPEYRLQVWVDEGTGHSWTLVT